MAALQSSISNLDDYNIVPYEDEADIYVVNTCTVTGKGDAESRRLVRRALRKNKKAHIIVTGCYAQINPEEIAKIEGVSLILGNEEKNSFGDYLQHISSDSIEPKIFVGDISNISPIYSMHGYEIIDFPTRTRAFLKVQDGCDSRCSYCIVPLARGSSRSLPPDEVLQQISGLCQRGYKEVVLCGVHLGGYGRDLNPNISLSYLIEKILCETDILRIRLSSIEPREITDDLIALVAKEDRVCKHFHIPLQSGDDKILRQMNRNYNTAFYEDLVLKIKRKIEDVGIGSDVMVGYPGEGEEHFNNTCRFIYKLPITYLHVFAYSPRPGTLAYHLRETVKGDVKRKRSDAIKEIGEKKNIKFKKSYMGRIMDVLIEEDRDDVTGLMKGYTGNYLKVLITTGNGSLKNQVVKVHLSEIVNYNLSGDMLWGSEL